MSNLAQFLPWIQVVLSALLVGGILLQQSEGGLGGAFGGSQASNPLHTKRGFEKKLFIATIIIAVLFIASTIAALLIA